MPGKTQESPYTVSSLTMELKSVIERRYTRIYVEGEISGWRPYPSGHVYFTLKDGGAQIQAVMFKSSFERCRARASLRDGAKVLVYANATIYPQRGNYQLVADIFDDLSAVAVPQKFASPTYTRIHIGVRV